MGKGRLLLNKIVRAVEIIAVLCLVCMVIMVFVNACCRYILGVSFNQTEELSRFCFIWLTFLGTVVAYHRKEHIIIPILLDSLPDKVRAVVHCITRVILTSTFSFFFYCAWIYTVQAMGYKASGTGITFGLVVMVLPFMSLCLLLIDFFDLADFISKHIQRKKNLATGTE
jgi:TRAP-type C4-dicarboxylate transport system permease small subunit